MMRALPAVFVLSYTSWRRRGTRRVDVQNLAAAVLRARRWNDDPASDTDTMWHAGYGGLRALTDGLLAQNPAFDDVAARCEPFPYQT